MPDNSKLTYSDIIQPDDSIDKLINQLSEANKQYGVMINAIRAGADRVVKAFKDISGATSSGRKAISDASDSASRLERAFQELEFATSETGQQVAWLRAQVNDVNKATVTHQRTLANAATSYDKLNADLKESVALYKSLTEAEREDSSMGQALLNDIISLKDQMSALNKSMAESARQMTEVEKAEQRLAYLESAEGQRLLDIKQKITQVMNQRKQQKVTVDALTAAQEKLAYAQSAENQTLKEVITQTQEANRIAQLQAQINLSAEGSYNRLSAQYSLNKIELNKMSKAIREGTEAGRKLEAETKAIYAEMIRLQEATGKHTLSVGNYAKTWDGLGWSVTQVVRELPAAAVSLNTFFLAISNNVPMVVDEINKLRAANKKAVAEGKPAVNITRQIISSLMGWNTALVVVLAIFSKFGKQIIQFVVELFTAHKYLKSFGELLRDVAKELEKTNASYGKHVVTLKRLSDSYREMRTEAEKTEWIKENEAAFKDLGLAIESVVQADTAFVNSTGKVIEAFKLRAKAAAAESLAEKEYEKALQKQTEGQGVAAGEPTFVDKLRSTGATLGLQPMYMIYGLTGNDRGTEFLSEEYSAEGYMLRRAGSLLREAKEATEVGNQYIKMYEGLNKEYEDLLKELGLKEWKKPEREKHGREPRDLTDILNRNDVTIQKKYQESVTKLYSDEYAKRRKEADDAVKDANNNLRLMFMNNEKYIANVDGRYKALTKEQKKQIAQQQEWLLATMENNLRYLALQLNEIEKDQQINALKIRRNTINSMNLEGAENASENHEATVATNITLTRDSSAMEESLVKEREILEQHLEYEKQLTLATNKALQEMGDENARSEEEILIEFEKKRIEIWTTYDKQILGIREKDIERELEVVRKGSDEELALLLRQNEIRRQLALSGNASLSPEEQRETGDINNQYDKSAKLIQGSFTIGSLEEQQALDKAIFNEVKHNSWEIEQFTLQQDLEMWETRLDLAKKGMLDWSDAQISEAEATVKKLKREVNDASSFIGEVGKKGLGHTLLEVLGLDDDQIKAVEDAAGIIIDNIKDIMQAEIDLAEKQVELAQERVDAAQSAYDAEVEARNNGYANSVATAKKELQDEKKNLQQRQKQLEAAQRSQQRLDTIEQTSSLITASANLWKSFSSIPIVGPALAAAAIAGMWASFVASKAKAKQVTALEAETYGEGGLEFLEGGSHASGNDIDLGTVNSRGKRMRAEGGEAMAIINKRHTRRYRRLLPDVVESLNKGTFEDKYLNAFDKADKITIAMDNKGNIDITRLEEDVRSIRKQNETKYFVLPDGSLVEQRKNIKRIIRRS